MNLLANLFVVAATTLGVGPLHHPQLTQSAAPTVSQAWDLGVQDAVNNRNDMPFLKGYTQLIDTTQAPGSQEQFVSSAIKLSPVVFAYAEGFASKRENWVALRADTAKLALTNKVETGRPQAIFSTLLTAISTPVGFSRIRPVPEPLRHILLSVNLGGKNYGPVNKPGMLPFQSLTSPDQRLVESPASSPNFYTVEHRPTYDIYRAYFRVAFDLANPDGTSRLGSPSGPDRRGVERRTMLETILAIITDATGNQQTTASKAAAAADAYIRS